MKILRRLGGSSLPVIASVALCATVAQLGAEEPPKPRPSAEPQRQTEDAGQRSIEERRARLRQMREEKEEIIKNDFQRLREDLRLLPPEERQIRLQALRAEWDRRREEFQGLPPAERQARLREWREQAEARPLELRPELMAARRRVRARLETQLSTLRAKKTADRLTAEEAKRLERLELIARTPAEPPLKSQVPEP